MEIKITSGLQANQELSIQAAQLRRAQTASSFSLRLNAEGKLDQRAFSELLTAARVSSAYKANQQHYQFKLKSDGSGHYLTLKQQGLWSRFKGVFGWGRETRERQRADAEHLIRGMSLSEINQARQQGQITDRTRFSDAKAAQQTIMAERGPRSRHRQAGSQSSSEKLDFEQLMGGTVVQQSDEQEARITQHVISGEQSYSLQPHRPLNAQSSPAERYADQGSQSENRQSDYGQIAQQQDSFAVAPNDDNVRERPTHYEPALFQNYAQLGDDDFEQQESDQVSDAHQSRGGQFLARLMQN